MALQIIIIVSRVDDIPDFITHVVEVKDMTVGRKQTRQEYLDSLPTPPPHMLSNEKVKEILALPNKDDKYDADVVVGMNKVSIV